MIETSLISKVLDEMRIEISILPKKINNVSQFPDLGLRSFLYGANAIFNEALPCEQNTENTVKIWWMQDVYKCRYILADVPTSDDFWVLGPYTLEDMTLTDIMRLCQELQLINVDMSVLRQYYLGIAKVRDETLFDSLINAYCQEVYGLHNYEVGFFKLEQNHKYKLVETTKKYTDHARESMNYRYSTEDKMIECISKGNYYGAIESISKLTSYNREIRSVNTLRNGKNYSIILNTLCRVAAEKGGVEPLLIDGCSNMYALEIESAGSLAELKDLRNRMINQYCKLVLDSTDEKYVPLVRQTIDIIESDFEKPVSLAEIANYLNVSANYLSSLFKKETGMTYRDYLNIKRIEYAKGLLQQTTYSIGEVARRCGIIDQNYFARIFKERENISPSEYRKREQS